MVTGATRVTIDHWLRTECELPFPPVLRDSQARFRARRRTVKPMTKEIPADHQVPSPAASQITQIRPVSAAIETNHSPRMNCLGSTPLETSIYHRPAVGPMTAIASTPRIGRFVFSGLRRARHPARCSRLHLQVQWRYNIGMSTTTVGFAVADEDQERLARLVEHFGGGNRSAYLRATLPVMESLARAERLRELQARNAERAAAAGQDYESLLAQIRRAYKGGAASR